MKNNEVDIAKYISLEEYLKVNDLNNLSFKEIVQAMMKAKKEKCLVYWQDVERVTLYRGNYHRYSDEVFYSDKETKESMYKKVFAMTPEEFTYYTGENINNIVKRLKASEVKNKCFYRIDFLCERFDAYVIDTYARLTKYFPGAFQVVDYVIRIAESLFINNENPDTLIKKFNAFRTDQKYWARKIIVEYFEPKYQIILLEKLNLDK